MLIAKSFSFEAAHIVRFCASKKCKTSIHGHSYKIELILESKALNEAGMVYDFGLLKLEIKQIIDSFDHSLLLFNKDNESYLKDAKKHSDRYVSLPLNISAENLSIILFALIEKLLNQTEKDNEVHVFSIKLFETENSYAQAFKNDVFNEDSSLKIDLNEIEFSKAIKAEWSDEDFYLKLLNNHIFINPKEI